MDNSSSQSKKTAENELNLFLDTQAGAKDAIELKALLNAYDAENGTPVRLPVREWPQRTSFHDVAIVSVEVEQRRHLYTDSFHFNFHVQESMKHD